LRSIQFHSKQPSTNFPIPFDQLSYQFQLGQHGLHQVNHHHHGPDLRSLSHGHQSGMLWLLRISIHTDMKNSTSTGDVSSSTESTFARQVTSSSLTATPSLKPSWISPSTAKSLSRGRKTTVISTTALTTVYMILKVYLTLLSIVCMTDMDQARTSTSSAASKC
jgi:hypothetical protein